ncbi:kynurenine formamidase [Antricoccus suffuscus]|uniref:Kynurenine formamidase n=1 Tax=Antricoccus suffuscus TaxID=1629062 RepID=A0A2T1A156_9ACTN|nr:cyclase family protein [Antricoccus suffuscus]PRZ42332.1 kynurenine formamidase [Antricoccus suffuscus]
MTHSNWGRWGPDDEAGALNLLTAATVKRGVEQVTEGTVISLAQPCGPVAMTSPHRHSPARFMDRDAGDYAVGTRRTSNFKFAEDTVLMPTHSGTHLDALAHGWEGDRLYNNHPSADTRSIRGAARCGADKLRPIVTRGVLLDIVALSGSALAASTGVTDTDLERAYEMGGVQPRSGDAALVRTGWWERGLSTTDYHRDEPGLTLDAAEWLAERDVAVVGVDNYAVEVQPSEPGSMFPVHLCLLHRNGVPLLENLDLSILADTGRSEFLFMLAPLPLEGSTASPVAPIAVL